MQTQDRILAYIQGRLPDAERAALQADMETDPDLNAEVTALLAARAALADTPNDLPSDGWPRLKSRIEAEAAPKTPPASANDNAKPMLMRLLQVAAIGAVAIIGWQAIETTLLQSDGAGFTTASVPPDAPTLQVFFNEAVSLGVMTATLADLDGTIIGGPSALGLYTIAFPDDASRDAAFTTLSSRPDLVQDVLRD